MDRIWLKSYPAGMPAEIDADRFDSIPDMLAQTVARFADRPAFHNLGHTLTYAALDRLSRDFAAFLQQLPGMGKGERVAIMSPNLLQYPVALFGILRAGMTVVNVNPLYTARELEHQLKDCGAKDDRHRRELRRYAATRAAEHVDRARDHDGARRPAAEPRSAGSSISSSSASREMVPDWRIDGAIGFRTALERGAKSPLTPVDVSRHDVAFLQYTGGTTGVAKGAMLTHRNVLANLEQTGVWVSGRFKEGAEIVIAPLPMYHVFCLSSTLSFMKWGSVIVLITNPRDLRAFVNELRKWKWSVMTGVNTLFNGLLNTRGFERLDFSAIKVIVGGGAAVQKAVAERWQQVTGSFITEAYGLTETSPGVCANPLEAPWNGTIGLPFPSTDVSIRDEAFNAVPPWTGDGDVDSHTGEICVRGPQVMKGYWNDACRNCEGHAGRMAEDRRHRPHGFARVLHDHRPQEGRDRRLGLQGLSERDRKRRVGAPGRPRMRGRRRARCEDGRSGEGRHREKGSRPDRKRRHRILQVPAHRLQGSPFRGVPRRIAEVADREGAAPRASRVISCARPQRRKFTPRRAGAAA